MKIGIDVSRALKEQKTGIELYSKYIIEGILKNLDAEIVLYTPSDLKETYLKKHLSKKNVSQKIIKGRRFWTLFHFSLELFKNKIDSLFVPSHTFPFFIPKKSLITIHDVAFKAHPEVYPFLEKLYLNWSTKRSVKKARKIIVPSESTKEDLVKYFSCDESKIVVVSHGVPQDVVYKFKDGEVDKIMKFFHLDKGQPFFMYVGRIELKKNLINLVKAFDIFSKKFPDYKLLLCGKRGYGAKKVFEEIRKLGLWNKIFAPGYVEDKEKFLLMKRSTAFMYATYYEGFGYPILECFQAGLPILVSDNSSIKEVASDCALYCYPEDPEDICRKMELLVQDQRACDILVEKGKERLKNFSWEKSVTKHLEVINELLK